MRPGWMGITLYLSDSLSHACACVHTFLFAFTQCLFGLKRKMLWKLLFFFWIVFSRSPLFKGNLKCQPQHFPEKCTTTTATLNLSHILCGYFSSYLFIDVSICLPGEKEEYTYFFYWHKYMIICYYSFISLPANNHFYV